MEIGKLNSINFGKIYYKAEIGKKPSQNQLKAKYIIEDTVEYNINDTATKIANLESAANSDVFVIAKKDGNLDIQLRKRLSCDENFNSKHPGRLTNKTTIPLRTIKAPIYGIDFEAEIASQFKEFIEEVHDQKCPELNF